MARALRRTRYRVILTARQGSLPRFALHELSESEHVRIRPLDVTSQEQREAIVEEAANDWGGIDILINNAGVSYRAVVEHVVEEERLAQMNVNFRSPMELIRLVLPGMRQKRGGRIITVSSVGGMMAMPTMAAYSASKFALEGALHDEERALGARARRPVPRALRQHEPLHRPSDALVAGDAGVGRAGGSQDDALPKARSTGSRDSGCPNVRHPSTNPTPRHPSPAPPPNAP